MMYYKISASPFLVVSCERLVAREFQERRFLVARPRQARVLAHAPRHSRINSTGDLHRGRGFHSLLCLSLYEDSSTSALFSFYAWSRDEKRAIPRIGKVGVKAWQHTKNSFNDILIFLEQHL